MNAVEELAIRFLDRLDFGADGCWRFAAQAVPSYHYPTFGGEQASRFAYRLFVGPLDDGLDIDHLCMNPACVNPAHLEPVTTAENVRRGYSPAARERRARLEGRAVAE